VATSTYTAITYLQASAYRHALHSKWFSNRALQSLRRATAAGPLRQQATSLLSCLLRSQLYGISMPKRRLSRPLMPGRHAAPTTDAATLQANSGPFWALRVVLQHCDIDTHRRTLNTAHSFCKGSQWTATWHAAPTERATISAGSHSPHIGGMGSGGQGTFSPLCPPPACLRSQDIAYPKRKTSGAEGDMEKRGSLNVLTTILDIHAARLLHACDIAQQLTGAHV